MRGKHIKYTIIKINLQYYDNCYLIKRRLCFIKTRPYRLFNILVSDISLLCWWVLRKDSVNRHTRDNRNVAPLSIRTFGIMTIVCNHRFFYYNW